MTDIGLEARVIQRWSGDTLVAVMKAADLRARDDAPSRRRLDFSREWAIVAERLMRTRSVVVGEVGAQQPTQMPLVGHDEVVEAFSANGPDDPLGEGILPGRVRRGENLVHTQAVDAAVKGVAVDRVTIAEEIPWGTTPRTRRRSRGANAPA